ncbi:hypothetical protein BY996DRAFT_6491652 [Phakopsora pachyrhizi]|nr:hypothetical protein BY996DRAFT_6491652 [Phakopsora pachyrhizi]
MAEKLLGFETASYIIPHINCTSDTEEDEDGNLFSIQSNWRHQKYSLFIHILDTNTINSVMELKGSSRKKNALLPDGFSWKKNSQPPEEYSKRRFTLPSLNNMIARVKCSECPKNKDDKIYPLQLPRVLSIFNGTIHYGSFPLPKNSHHS